MKGKVLLILLAVAALAVLRSYTRSKPAVPSSQPASAERRSGPCLPAPRRVVNVPPAEPLDELAPQLLEPVATLRPRGRHPLDAHQIWRTAGQPALIFTTQFPFPRLRR